MYVTPVVSCAAGRHGRLVHGLAVRLSRRGAVLGRGCFQKCLTPQLPSPRCAACRSWRTARRSAYGKWQHERQRARQRRSGPTAAVGRRSIGTCVRHGDVTWTTLLPLLLRQRLARPVTLTLSAPTFSLPCLMSGVWHRARGGGARACRGARLALRPQGVADTSCQWAVPPRVLGTCRAHGPAVMWCSLHLFLLSVAAATRAGVGSCSGRASRRGSSFFRPLELSSPPPSPCLLLLQVLCRVQARGRALAHVSKSCEVCPCAIDVRMGMWVCRNCVCRRGGCVR